MSKTLLSFIALFCGMILAVNAQIPNAGFEDWTDGDPDGWATSNVFEVGLVTVVQTPVCHSGASALRGEVANFMGTPMAPIIQSGPGGTGFPISEQYHSIEMYYKFSPTGGDRFGVNVALIKDGEPIANGAVALTDAVTTYTHLVVPLNYSIVDMPDSAIIQIMIVGPVSGTDFHVGSEMFVDDLDFSTSTGIGDPSASVNAGCYPNPASRVINISAAGQFPVDALIRVYDICGHEVKSMNSRQYHGIFSIAVEDLAPGIYLYSLEGPGSRSGSKFIIAR